MCCENFTTPPYTRIYLSNSTNTVYRINMLHVFIIHGQSPCQAALIRASWRFSLFFGGGGGKSGTLGGGHSVEDHYLHKHWIIFWAGE